MAYIKQEQKKEKQAAIKKLISEKYADLKIKYSMGIEHHSKLRFTISASTIDFKKIYSDIEKERIENYGDQSADDYISPDDNWQVNEYYLEDNFDGRILELLQDVRSFMNSGNHDNSDIMTDYFDVGWYINITIGRWDKPYTLIAS